LFSAVLKENRPLIAQGVAKTATTDAAQAGISSAGKKMPGNPGIG